MIFPDIETTLTSLQFPGFLFPVLESGNYVSFFLVQGLMALTSIVENRLAITLDCLKLNSVLGTQVPGITIACEDGISRI